MTLMVQADAAYRARFVGLREGTLWPKCEFGYGSWPSEWPSRRSIISSKHTRPFRPSAAYSWRKPAPASGYLRLRLGLFYEERLRSRAGLENQEIRSTR